MSAERASKIASAWGDLSDLQVVPVRALARLAGLLASIATPIPEAYAFARALYHAFAHLGRGDPEEMWDCDVPVPEWVRSTVGEFLLLLPALAGATMSAQPADVVLSSDASDTAVGGVVRPWEGTARWPYRVPLRADARGWHINRKETLGVHIGLEAVSGLRRRKVLPDTGELRVYVRVDNTVTLYSSRKGSASPDIQRDICATLLAALRLRLRVVAVQYVPSAANVAPDALSRLSHAEGWSLRPAWFSGFCQELRDAKLPLPTMEAMVRGTPLLPRYSDPGALCWDFFSQSLAGEILWVNPLPRACAATVRHLRRTGARGYFVGARQSRAHGFAGLALHASSCSRFRSNIPPSALRWEGGGEGTAPPPSLEVLSFSFRRQAVAA